MVGAVGEPRKARIAVITTHVRGLGPSNHLEQYLVPRCRTVLAVDHPLIHSVPTISTFRLYEEGRLVREGSRETRVSEPVRFVLDVMLTVYWTFRFAPRFDLFVGVDALNCISGLIARPLSRGKRVIFYVIDWSPRRFAGRILNGVYHFSDRFAALCATETWNQSHAIDEGRWPGRFWGMIGERAKRRVRIVPNAVQKVDDGILQESRQPYRLVFLGHLLEKQGLQLVIRALPEVARRLPEVELIVVGTGPYEKELRELASSIGVLDRVRFLGYVEDEEEVLRLLASASCGLAPYLAGPDSFSQFADPGKIKNYLAVGLPVLMTDVPYNARDLERKGCAFVVQDNLGDIASGIIEALSEDADSRAYRRTQALESMKGLDWHSVFGQALAADKLIAC